MCHCHCIYLFIWKNTASVASQYVRINELVSFTDANVSKTCLLNLSAPVLRVVLVLFHY